MPELEAITLLEQANGKRRMLRFYSSRICIVADYRKNPGEFLFLIYIWLHHKNKSQLPARRQRRRVGVLVCR